MFGLLSFDIHSWAQWNEPYFTDFGVVFAALVIFAPIVRAKMKNRWTYVTKTSLMLLAIPAFFIGTFATLGAVFALRLGDTRHPWFYVFGLCMFFVGGFSNVWEVHKRAVAIRRNGENVRGVPLLLVVLAWAQIGLMLVSLCVGLLIFR